MTQETEIIENFVKEKLGDEYRGINFKQTFDSFDLSIVILTKTHGFIEFPVNFEDLLDKTSEETHEHIFNGLKDAIEKEMTNG